MARGKFKCGGGGKQWKSKSGVCTLCARAHPKGSKQRAKARAKGWEACSSVALRRKLGKSYA